MAHRPEKEKAVNVQVLLRCRPFSGDELRCNAPQVVTCNDLQREVSLSQAIAGKQIDRVFTFDKVFGPSSLQIDLYDQAVVPIVNEVLEGFNCTIFAYGQTGTGKTYTMEGECRRSKSKPNGELPPHAGVIPRAVKQIFQTLESQNAEYSVKVTYLELYNEEITDLLAPEEISKTSLEERQKKALPLMEDGKKGVLVRGLEEEIVTSSDEIFTLLERGSAKRRTAETLLNKQSSRSHSLFTVTIHIKEATPEGEELIKCGKLNLVDLAGSENISRSGAREGRAREAGEINKSLLTLGRVITALVEHYGHIPYRDSKLTRLLRDSLGGRTKTCIIATVSPAVLCFEETLSTLDYAHRAKNIKNRPEVNQKMMKATLIKDMHGEIERLKSELHATREKSGVYIPAERYYQDECDRKARIEKIELMDAMMENKQKQLDDLQEKYDVQLNRSSDLCIKLETTEKSLENTVKILATAMKDLKHSQYNLKEKDFIISELKVAENALINQALALRSELEKSVKDNTSLFSKIGREDQLNTTNKAVINKFQTDFVEKLSALCSSVVSSITQQKKQIQNAEDLCNSCLDFHDKSLLDLKEYVSAAKIHYVSHLEALQNDIHLQKVYINGSLEEISSLNCTHLMSLEHIMVSGGGMADQIISLLQDKISNQRGKIADFVHDLRERFSKSTEYTKLMSAFINELLDNLQKQSSNLQDRAIQIHDVQIKQIVDFREAFETQSRLESDKFLSQMQSLLSTHIYRQNELVADRLASLRNASSESKEFLGRHASSMVHVTNDAKRKWNDFAQHAKNSSVDGSDSASFKHCRIEHEFENCVSTVDAASKLWKNTNKSITETAKEHVAAVDALVSTMTDSNEQHDLQTASARIAAEKDISKNNDCIFHHFKGITEHEHTSVSELLQTLESHSGLICELDKDHGIQAEKLERYAEGTFQLDYKEYEPSGQTPIKSEPELPSRTVIESLRAMPMDGLLEDFGDKHPYVSTKEPKLCLEPRSPLIPRN